MVPRLVKTVKLEPQLNTALDSDGAAALIDSLAPPRAARRELVIDQQTGRVRQAGAASPEGKWVEERRTRCERDLFYFLRTVFNMHWLHPPLHLPVCRWMQKVPPRSKALMMPRNHCKSTIVAQGVPPHMLIQPKESNVYFPGLPGASTRILMVGEAEERIADHYRPIKQAFEGNELFRAFWPHIMWKSPKNQAPSWNNSELIINRPDNYPDPTIRAIGVGGATTGAHPNVMIKDDLTTEKAMNEPPTMVKAIEWNRNSRALFEDPLKSLEFFTFTRWAVTDLASDIETDASVAMNTRWRQLIEDGEVIYPSKFGDDPDLITQLLLEKHGPVMFALQYMNSVIQSGLTDFDQDDLRFFRLIGQQLEFDEADADDRLAQEVNHVVRKGLEDKKVSLQELQSLRGLKLSDPRVVDATRMRYLRQVRGA